MKLVLLLFALAALAVAAGSGTPARAQNYPWCALIDGGSDAAVNCGFVSFDQCMETIRGEGGFCMPNTQYQPPTAQPHPSHRASRQYPHQQS